LVQIARNEVSDYCLPPSESEMGVFSDEKAFKDFNPVMVDILD
jgi:hypothetical protein